MTTDEADVLKLPQDPSVPDLTVFEMALITAITRAAPHLGEDGIAARLSDWFLQPVRVPETRLAMDGLVQKGMLEPSPTGAVHECMPTMKGIDCVTTLYGGCIRMLDRGMGLLNVRLLSNLFDGLGDKS